MGSNDRLLDDAIFSVPTVLSNGINRVIYTLKWQISSNKFKFKLESKASKVSMNVDLLYPDPVEEQRKHKLKRLVQGPNSYFLEIKCAGCQDIVVVYSHANTPVFCPGCTSQISIPTGGKCAFTSQVERYRQK
ncbi:SSU ribosomal protein S27E [Giardia duodenalis]|nr:Ribosomal protein S27 [Giardia intestinalis ATCC 50581]ESU43579.1 SSU ribosomal protein S27E [Giardia intestinalis]